MAPDRGGSVVKAQHPIMEKLSNYLEINHACDTLTTSGWWLSRVSLSLGCLHLFRLSYRTNSVNSICPIRQVECTSNHLPSASQKGSSHRVQVYSWKRYGRSGECPKPACKLQTTDVYVPLALASQAIWATALALLGSHGVSCRTHRQVSPYRRGDK